MRTEGGLSFVEAEVKNEGDAPAFFVYPYDSTEGCAILASDAYFTLLPGESRRVALTLKGQCGLFFEHPKVSPEIAFGALNG